MTSRRRIGRGDIVLVEFPFSDLSGQKLRPALVVGIAIDGDFILAFITSRMDTLNSDVTCNIDENNEEFGDTGLKRSSSIRLDKLVTLERSTFIADSALLDQQHNDA